MNCFPRSRIATRARSAFTHAKGSEANDCNLVVGVIVFFICLTFALFGVQQYLDERGSVVVEVVGAVGLHRGRSNDGILKIIGRYIDAVSKDQNSVSKDSRVREYRRVMTATMVRFAQKILSVANSEVLIADTKDEEFWAFIFGDSKDAARLILQDKKELDKFSLVLQTVV